MEPVVLLNATVLQISIEVEFAVFVADVDLFLGNPFGPA
jgi:hypothetical protein